MPYCFTTLPQRAISPTMNFCSVCRVADCEVHAELLGELLAQVRLVQHFHELGVKLVEHRLGVPAGAKMPHHASAEKPGKALLGERRHVRHRLRALVAGHRDRAQLAAFHVRRDQRDRADAELDVAAQHVHGHRPAAFVGHVHDLEAARLLHERHREMPEAAAADRAVGHRIRLRLRRLDHVAESLVGLRRCRVTMAIGAVPTSITGARSFTVSNGRFGMSVGLTACVSNTNTKV